MDIHLMSFCACYLIAETLHNLFFRQMYWYATVLQMPTGGEPPVKKRQEAELRLSVSATKKEAKIHKYSFYIPEKKK